MQVGRMLCCGTREITNLSFGAPQAQIRSFWDYLVYARSQNRDRQGHFIFTEAGTRARYGRDFAAYIKEHKLGGVQKSEPALNPNTGRRITVWTWQPDMAAIRAHILEIGA